MRYDKALSQKIR